MNAEDISYYFKEYFSAVKDIKSGANSEIVGAVVKKLHPNLTGLKEDDKVALKSPTTACTSSKIRTGRESQTLETLMKQNVPEIITYYGLIHTKDDEVPAIVEELAEGNLATYYRKKEREGINPTELLMDKVIQRIGNALSAVHKIGFLHRDVKPSNVYVCPGEIIKLGDFGSAGPNHQGEEWNPKMGKGGSSRGPHGTENYLAPESLLADENEDYHFSVSTEIYSLGCLGLFLIVGKEPFEDLAAEHTPIKLKKFKEDESYINKKIEELTVGKNISTYKIQAIRKAISPDSKNRQKSVRAFLDEYKHGPKEAVLFEIKRKVEAALEERITTKHGATQIGTVDAFLGAYGDMLRYVQKTRSVSPIPEEIKLILEQRANQDKSKIEEYFVKLKNGKEPVPERDKQAERKQFFKELWALFHCWGNEITEGWITDKNAKRVPIGQIDEEEFEKFYSSVK